MDHPEASRFALAVGPVTLGLRFDVDENTRLIARYFDGYASSAPVDLALDFTVVAHAEIPDIPQSLVQAKRLDGSGFAIGDEIFRGRFDAESRCWEIHVKNIVTKGQITRVFEQLLYQAFYSVRESSRSGSFLVHSAGVAVGSDGFLFIGASGMGKSTVASLSRSYGVVNDEINILSPRDGALRLHRSPFNSYFERKNGAESDLRAVFLLAHDAECRLEPVSPARAVAEITAQIVPPLGLEDGFDPAVAAEMMDLAALIVGAVPVYRLFFPVIGGFWPMILATCT